MHMHMHTHTSPPRSTPTHAHLLPTTRGVVAQAGGAWLATPDPNPDARRECECEQAGGALHATAWSLNAEAAWPHITSRKVLLYHPRDNVIHCAPRSPTPNRTQISTDLRGHPVLSLDRHSAV